MWQVKHPALDGNCTVRLAPDGVNFQTLFPEDRSGDANGKFACGRKTAYEETKSFKLPDTMTCDQCVIQWIWETYQGVYFQCADIEVAFFASVEQCAGRCKNGGVCVSNQCKCTVGFYGDFCQHENVGKKDSVGYIGYFVLFISFCAILSLVSVAVYYYFNTHKLPPNLYQWIEANCPWCIRKPGLLDTHESRSDELVSREGGQAQSAAGQREESKEEVFQSSEVVQGGEVRRRVVTTTTTTRVVSSSSKVVSSSSKVVSSSSKEQYQVRIQDEDE